MHDKYKFALGSPMVLNPPSGIPTCSIEPFEKEDPELGRLIGEFCQGQSAFPRESRAILKHNSLTDIYGRSIHVKKGLKSKLNFKVQRNDPCPCGSGKKYKKCCI